MPQSYKAEFTSPGLRPADIDFPAPSPAYAEPEGDVSVRSLLAALYRQRLVFLSVFLFVVALGFLYILGSHKKYSSKMKLLVQNDRSAQVISAGRQEAPVSAAEISDEELGSESEILQSLDVLNEVVDPGWGQVPQAQRPASEQGRHEAAVGTLQKNLVVLPIRRSHLLSVELITRDPYVSTKTLQALLRAFLNKKLQLSHSTGTTQLFTQESDQFRKQWQDAQNQLAAYQQTHKIVSTSEQESALQRELFEAETQLRGVNVDVADLQHKMSEDKAQLSVLPNRKATQEVAIPSSGSIDQLRTRLSELTLSRIDLIAKYRPEDRLIQQVDREISQVQKSISDYSGTFYSETSSNVNPTWQLVEQDLTNNRSRLQGLLGRRAALAAQVDDLQQGLSSTESEAETLNSLQHRVAELEANFQVASQKRDEAHLTEVLDQHQLLNVAVAQEPTFSRSPVRPQPLIDGLLTFITALFMALFAVFIAESSRSTIANEHDLTEAARFPILATIPVQNYIAT